MKNKLHWTYGDDFFEKKSDVADTVFQDAPVSDQPDVTEESFDHKIDLDLLDYDIEYFDTLRDNIVIPPGKSSGIPRTIAMTSSDFNQGVSTIVSKLALTFSKYEKGPVLLIDTNFAKPTIHKIFGIQPSPGIGEYLIDDTDKEIKVYPSPIKNLHIIPAGDIITNPTSKFDSPKFLQLLSKWKTNYSYILFDTPPLQCDMKQCDMNSSVRLASLVDGVVIVVEAERDRRELLLNMKQRLLDANANILGVVLNKTKYYIPKWLYNRL